MRRHWPGRGSASKALSVDFVAHGDFLSGELLANLFREVVGKMLAVRRRAVRVVEVKLEGHSVVDSFAYLARRTRHISKRSCTGRSVAAVMVSRKFVVPEQRVPISSTSERPRCVNVKRRKAKVFFSAVAGR